MGAVYRARHIYLDEDRAIKLIQTELAGSQDFVNRFIREAKILSKLRHPNLVQLYEFGTLEDKQFFMVLEFLRGETVLQRLKKIQHIPLLEAFRIIREAAMGLDAGHQQGIIHRDLSPDNLFLVPLEGGIETTKVIDFGIARPTAKETQRFTRTNMLIGKLEYISPEQCGLIEEGQELDKRADIYSLGVTFYHMITGRLPFTSATPQGYLYKHLNEYPRPLSSYADCGPFPAELQNFISKAMAKRRDDRHSSMKEVIEHLNSIEVSMTPSLHAPTKRFGTLPLPGSLFANRYLIEKRIGEGGMGTVFKASDQMLNISVAIKALNRELVSNEASLNRLKREVILARKVSHPNVCRIYDIGESDGIHYVSMEYVEGRSLSEILNHQGALSAEESVMILRQILLALGEAHRAGIVHRDLKPQNIMVDSTGKATMMDFGISFSPDAVHLTQTGMMIGTPRYMAPEQFGNQEIDSRADLYSCGVILYEMLTGHSPFDARTPASMMYAHLNMPPRRPSEFLPRIEPKLEFVILRALEKNRDRRFQTTHEFLSALDTKGHPPAAFMQEPKEPAFSVEETSSGSHVFLFTLILLLLLASGGAAYFYIFLPHQTAKHKELPAVTPPSQIEETPTETVSPVTKVPEVITPEPPTQTEVVQPALRHYTVRSRPEGASIFIDAQDSGLKTPADIDLQPGESHQVELRLTDHEPKVFTINKDTVDVPIIDLPTVLKPGTLMYEGEFPITVYLNEKPLLNSEQNSSILLNPGEYKILVVSNLFEQAYIRAQQLVEIRARGTTTIRMPAMSKLTLTAQPSNCVLFIDGERIDTAPLFNYSIQSGVRRVRVIWERLRKESTATFDFDPGKSKTLRAIIENGKTELFEE
jgi:serine/threonine protein kinase